MEESCPWREKNKVLGLRKKKEAQRKAWVMGLSKKWYTRKPKREAGRSYAKLHRIHQSQGGSLENAGKNQLGFGQLRLACPWTQEMMEVIVPSIVHNLEESFGNRWWLRS